jgi:hypothetical protein
MSNLVDTGFLFFTIISIIYCLIASDIVGNILVKPITTTSTDINSLTRTCTKDITHNYFIYSCNRSIRFLY